MSGWDEDDGNDDGSDGDQWNEDEIDAPEAAPKGKAAAKGAKSSDWGEDDEPAGEPEPLSEEAIMENLLYDAEGDEKRQPAKALASYLKYLTKADAVIKGNPDAEDIKRGRSKCLVAALQLHIRLKQFAEAATKWKEVIKEYASAGLGDGHCTTIFRVLAEAPAEAKGDELKQLEPLFTIALAIATAPTALPYVAPRAPVGPKSPKVVEGKSPRAATDDEEPKAASTPAKKGGKRKDKDPFDTEDKIKPPAEVKKQKKEAKAADDDDSEKKESTDGDDAAAASEETKVEEEEVKYVPLRESLWFGIQLELSRLYVRAKLYAKATELVNKIYTSPFTSGEQKIALKAVELTMHIDKADRKAADVTLAQAQELMDEESKGTIQLSQVDASSLAVVRRELALKCLQPLATARLSDAFKHFDKAYTTFQQIGIDEQSIFCLKYLIVIQLLLKRKSLFFSNKYKALSDHKEIQPLTAIVEAYELNVAHKLKNAIRDQKAKLLADPIIAPFVPQLELLTPSVDVSDQEDIRAVYRNCDPSMYRTLDCSICLEDFGDAPHRTSKPDPAELLQRNRVLPKGVRLFRCDGHYFHRHCIAEWMEKSNICPVCGVYYGKVVGAQPEGKMNVNKTKTKLAGFAGCGTIQLDFEFPAGTQAEHHPHAGLPYSAAKIAALLPDNADGQAVLKLMEAAWERKLLFKIDDRSNIVDNSIPMKKANGYPDTTYIDVVREALQAKGVTA